jgi:hypothetical protein
MDPDGRVQIGVGRCHDSGGRPAGRQTCDVDPLRIDRIVPYDLASDACDQRRLPAVPLLVAGAKPIPAFRLVGPGRLLRIDHEAISLFRQEVHPGAGREVARRLGAVMKHDDQRKRFFLGAAWNESLVIPASIRAAEGACDEPRAIGCDIRRGRQARVIGPRRFSPGKSFRLSNRAALSRCKGAEETRVVRRLPFSSTTLAFPADLSGFTRLSSVLDPEETHGLLDSYFDVIDNIVVNYGGTIDKHIGDWVMAVFGATTATAVCALHLPFIPRCRSQ